jgi:sterol desaturase/sphingolipid hydroxylase (fatty acid hydroxylase superfamily)
MSNASQGLITRTLMPFLLTSMAGSLRRALHAMSMSRTNYRLAYLTDFACVLIFGYLGLHASTAWYGVASLLIGGLAFTFVEYAMHRWLFHTSSLLAGELHTSHHDDPNQPTALPFWSSAVSAPILFWLLTQFLSAPLAHWMLCGFFAAYCAYGVLHHLQHSVRIKNVPYRWLRKKWIAHAVHHGRVNVNFGVTTSLWDRVFGTYQAPKR